MKEYTVKYRQYKKQLNKADNSQINWEDSALYTDEGIQGGIPAV